MLGDMETASIITNQLKQIKSEYEKILPNFVFPMIVEEKMLSKAANWEAQFDQWDRQVCLREGVLHVCVCVREGLRHVCVCA